MKYRTHGNELILDNGTVVRFDLPIRKAIDVVEVIIVMLDVPPRQVFTENIFGVSDEGKIIWQIERIPEAATPVCRYMHLTERYDDAFLRQLEQSHPEWKGLSEHVPGTFFAGNCGGADVIVDARTGKVVRTFGSR